MKSTCYFSLLFMMMAWCEPLLPTRLVGNGATVAAADVVSYTLVNADTDADILTMTPGIVLNLATLPTRNLNIRANTNPATTGSVVFALSGTQTRVVTENVAPYALFSDYLGDYFPWTPSTGNYTLLAIPFDGPFGTGTAGTPLTLLFSIINTGTNISSFTLVNADTDRDVLTITAGMTLNLSALPRNLNIRANANATTVSVELSLTGTQTHFEAQNVAPYSLFGDFNGDYFAWTPTPIAGVYTLTATPFNAPNGGGQAGAALTIAFTLTGTAPLPVQLTAFTAEERGDAAVQLRWNTANELNNETFEVQRSSDGKFFSVLHRATGHGTTTIAHDYSYTDEQLPSNATTLYYRLRQVDTDGTATFSPVRTVAVRLQASALQVFSPVVPDGLLHYAYSGPTTGTEQLELYTLMGQRQGRFALAAAGAGTVPVAGLPPGAYVLRLVSEKGHYTGRFVLP